MTIATRVASFEASMFGGSACSAGFPHGLQQFCDILQKSANEESFNRRVASVFSALIKERRAFGDSAALEKMSAFDCRALTHFAWGCSGAIFAKYAREKSILPTGAVLPRARSLRVLACKLGGLPKVSANRSQRWPSFFLSVHRALICGTGRKVTEATKMAYAVGVGTQWPHQFFQ